MASEWLAYGDLAWTEDWLADPAEYEAEVGVYVELLERYATPPLRTLLHLGCGAGGHDRVFKRYFSVTGVDLSPAMLAEARARHPDVEYVEGDMRAVRLGRRFDAVAIPDSIDYMASREDLERAIGTAVAHLRPGGVLLVVGKPSEIFRDNDFVYSGERDGVHITVFENDHVDPSRPNTYEATLVYLIRRRGELTIRTDRHVLGLFPQAVWDEVFADAGLTVREHTLEGVYDTHLLGDGAYPMRVFIGRRRE